jgi:hypothetical protein
VGFVVLPKDDVAAAEFTVGRGVDDGSQEPVVEVGE